MTLRKGLRSRKVIKAAASRASVGALRRQAEADLEAPAAVQAGPSSSRAAVVEAAHQLRVDREARKASMRCGERSAYGGSASTAFITASTIPFRIRPSMHGPI